MNIVDFKCFPYLELFSWDKVPEVRQPDQSVLQIF